MSADLHIFDLDGTLVDSLPEIYRSFQHAVESVNGVVPSPEEFVQSVGTSMSKTVQDLFPDWSERRRGLFRKHFGRAYSQWFLLSKPYSGVTEVLEKCGDRCVIVTNKDRRWAKPLLENLGWGEIDLICPEHGADRKPSPKMILEAKAQLVRRHGDLPCLSVGDTTSDRLASLAAEVPFMGVRWSPHDLGSIPMIQDWSSFNVHGLASTSGGD